MLATSIRPNQLPGTASWLLAATLLLGLLCLGGLARPAFVPAQPQSQASRPAAPAPARVVPSSWRPSSP